MTSPETETSSRSPQQAGRGTYNAGRREIRARVDHLFDSSLAFRPRMSGSVWAERYGRIPKGTGAESGPVTLYGYQRGLLDVMCDPRIPQVTVLKAARVGYTRCFTLALGYHLHHAPTLCTIAQPTIPDAEEFGGTEIGPMLRETPVLASLMRVPRKGEKPDKATFYQLTNGASSRLVGAASDDAFRRYSACFMAADEIDGEGWTPGGKTQGDKLKLFWTRGETFYNRKLVVGSTPLLEETSRVWRRWLQSDQRRYFVPCPQCGEEQFLDWGGRDENHGLKWEVDADGRLASVWYQGRCGCIIDEGHKAWMDARGEWRPTAVPRQAGHVGFHLWTGMSLNANASWPTIVQEWLDAQEDPATLVQPFVNLRLGRTYRASYGQELKSDQFLGRREAYEAEVPSRVRFLTAGADVQSTEGKDPRIEVAVYGWGDGLECWLIGHWVFKGDPALPEVWDSVDALLNRRFKRVDGSPVVIQAAAVDSGGHHTSETYAFCNERRHRRVWAIKGRSEQQGKRGTVWPRKPSAKLGSVWYMIGGNAARDWAYGSLAVSKPGPRCVHFPQIGAEGSREIDEDFFAQLTREKLRTVKGRYTEWEKPSGAREAGVCLVYAYAALTGLQAQHAAFLDICRTSANRPQAAPAPSIEADAQEPEATVGFDDRFDTPDVRGREPETAIRPERQHSAFRPHAQSGGWMQRRRD